MTTLALTELTLPHFRSHKLARISCGPLPVAIYGPNGAGKTNILEAVSLFSPGRGMRRASAEDMTRRPEALGWKITGLLQSQEQTHEVEMWSENGNPRSTKANSKPVPQNRLAELSRVLWLIPAMDRLWIEGAEGRRRFLDRMALSFFPNHAEASLTYEKTMRERNKLLKENVRDPMWYGVLESRLAETGAIIHENRVKTLDFLSAAQAKAETPFPTADLELMVSAVIQLMDHLDIEKAHLAGHSMGGLVAGQTAINHPGRVASLSFICSAGLGPEINDDYIDGFVSALSRKELKPKLKHLFADQGLVSRTMVDDLLKYKRLDGVQSFLEGLKANLFDGGKQSANIVAGLEAVDCPQQVIWGEEDAVIPQSHANAITGATVTVVAGAGHMVQMEESSRVNELIKDML